MNPSSFKIVIVRPFGYAHSVAFQELAETLHHGLLSLGHSSEIVENGFDRDAINLILGWHMLLCSAISQLPERCIVYNLEQLDERNHPYRQALFDFSRRFEIWDYSPRNIELLHAAGFHVPVRLVPIGYVPQLSRIKPAKHQDIDVLFYGALNPRRTHVLDALHATGRKVCCVTAPPDLSPQHRALPPWVTTCSIHGVYGEKRDALIARAKVVLNLHYYESSIFEMVRVSYLLANRKAVVAECNPGTQVDEDIRAAGKLVPYETLVPACLDLLRDAPARTALQERAFEIMSARDESVILREALAGWQESWELKTRTVAPGSPPSPLVSVVLTTQNGPWFLRRALASLLNQTCQDFEVLLVNDSGVDISTIADEFMACGLKLNQHSLPDSQGQSASRNLGIRHARGRYIAYLEDGDLYYPDHLETLVKALSEGDAKVAYTDSMRVNEEERNGEWIERSREPAMSHDFNREHLLRENLTPIQNVMHERICWEVCGPYDESLAALEDWDYLIRLSHRWDFVHVPKVTAEIHWRTNGSDMRFANGDAIQICRQLISRKNQSIARSKEPARPMVNLVTPSHFAREAFLYEPDWTGSEWAEVLLSYLQAFSPGESVALVLILNPAHPNQIPLEQAQALVLNVVDHLGKETFPDVILEEKSGSLLRTLRNYQHLQWIPQGKGRAEGMVGPFGIRFAQARYLLTRA